MFLLDDLSKKQPPILYHYTSFSTLIKIVESHKMWAGNINYMNDRAEFTLAVEITLELIKKRVGYKRHHFRELDFCREVKDKLEHITQPDVYICCFSAKDDLLSQWRGYCPNGLGFSIGFDFDTLKLIGQRQGFRLAPCLYKPQEQQEIIRRLIQYYINGLRSVPKGNRREEYEYIQKQASSFTEELTLQAPIIKHKAFEEEDEWRLISGRIEPTDKKVGVRSGTSTLVPYYKLDILTDNKRIKFADVVISPVADESLSVTALSILLQKHEVESTPPRPSDIPYRNW